MWALHCALQLPDSADIDRLHLEWANDLLMSTFLSSFDRKGRVCLWNIECGNLSKVLTCDEWPLVSSVYLPTLDSIAVVEEGKVVTWPLSESVRKGRPHRVWGNTYYVHRLVLSPDGGLLAAISLLHGIEFWDTKSERMIGMVRCDVAEPSWNKVAFSQPAKLCAIAEVEGVIQVRDLGPHLSGPQEEEEEEEEEEETMTILGVAPNLSLALSLTREGQVAHICDAETLRPVVQLQLPPASYVPQMQFSSSGAWVKVRYSLDKGKIKGRRIDFYELVSSEGKLRAVNRVFFTDAYHDGKCSPSGELWACVTAKMIEVHDLRTGKTIAVYEVPRHVKRPQVVALSDSKQDTPFTCVVAAELRDAGWRTPISAEDENTDDGTSEGSDPSFTVMLLFLEHDQQHTSIRLRGTLKVGPSDQHGRINPAVALSPAKGIVISLNLDLSSSTASCLRIWNLLTLEEISVDHSFPQSSGKMDVCVKVNCLQLDWGNYPLRKDSWESFRTCECGNVPVYWLRSSPQWLIWAGRPFFWLPPEHRNIRHVFIARSTVIIQSWFRRALSITFDRAKVEQSLGF